jgi:hypothetical protein
LRESFRAEWTPDAEPLYPLEIISRPGAIIDLKLSHSARIGLFTVSILMSAAVCSAQSTSQTQTSDPAPSAQSPETSSSKPDAGSAKQDKPADQPPPPNSQLPDSPAPVKAQQDQDKDKTQQDKDKAQQDKDKAQPDKTKAKDDRMFYVMPNYLTVGSESQVKPLNWKEKFSIAAKGSFDPYEFVVVGVVAGIRQAENSYPAFGQGFKGYAKRYGAAFADQVDGNIMVGGVFPTILKTDPRYFQLNRGTYKHRFGYAISRIVVTRTDSGRQIFNVPEFAGNGVAIAISNFYYPAADRGVWSSLQGFATQVGIDAFGNELKEFWPDIHHYLQKKHERRLQKQQEQTQQPTAPN